MIRVKSDLSKEIWKPASLIGTSEEEIVVCMGGFCQAEESLRDDNLEEICGHTVLMPKAGKITD